MKRIIFILLAAAILFSSCDGEPSARQVAVSASNANAQAAVTAVPIPLVSYFQEKRTIAKWATRWDKPSLPAYVYLVSFGKVLGYYVADGKPASTRSYLTPEYKIGGSSYGYYEESLPDIDGTYGDNNPGIRFFTAEGVAVEWAGDGASYLYSDALLPFDVPRLNTAAK